MEISTCVLSPDYALETVKVKLSLKGLVLGVAVVPRKNLLAESFYVEHSEGIPITNPSDHGGVLFIQDGVELGREAQIVHRMRRSLGCGPLSARQCHAAWNEGRGRGDARESVTGDRCPVTDADQLRAAVRELLC